MIWCTERANEHGFADDPTGWANLGQGAPEVDDDIKGSFQRPKQIDISMAGREYGPTAGIKSLRAAIANLYNAHHREGKASQYSWENVAVVPVTTDDQRVMDSENLLMIGHGREVELG